MQVRAVLLTAVLMLAPLAARAADLVVWWEEGFNPEEDGAIEEIVAAFEQRTGKQVELVFHPLEDLSTRVSAALAAGSPPDFVYGTDIDYHYGRWAQEGRLADLADALGPLASLFSPDALERATLLDATTGRRSLHALPMGQTTHHVHVWKSLLARAGLTLDDIPREWEAFWSFWCEKVQPAVRRATGRDDIYGVGLSMSVSGDTSNEFWQFVRAYEADYVTRDGRLVIDDPVVRTALVTALDRLTVMYREGCSPPDVVRWDQAGNNEAFLAQQVVMTPNVTLSIPSALRTTRPEDYRENAATIAWPSGAHGQALAIHTGFFEAAVFRGGHEEGAKDFVRFLVGDGWLAHWINFAGDRLLPSMPALLDQPVGFGPGDPHRTASAIQFQTQPRAHDYGAVSGEWRHRRVEAENVWAKAVHRVAADGLTPEQAVDEAIAQIKQILSE
jgi:multiple sugar transport system substrate-binding protein